MEYLRFLFSLPLSSISLGAIFEWKYPHDGQNGLGAVFFGLILSSGLAGLTLTLSFLVLFMRAAAEA